MLSSPSSDNRVVVPIVMKYSILVLNQSVEIKRAGVGIVVDSSGTWSPVSQDSSWDFHCCSDSLRIEVCFKQRRFLAFWQVIECLRNIWSFLCWDSLISLSSVWDSLIASDICGGVGLCSGVSNGSIGSCVSLCSPICRVCLGCVSLSDVSCRRIYLYCGICLIHNGLISWICCGRISRGDISRVGGIGYSRYLGFWQGNDRLDFHQKIITIISVILGEGADVQIVLVNLFADLALSIGWFYEETLILLVKNTDISDSIPKNKSFDDKREECSHLGLGELESKTWK